MDQLTEKLKPVFKRIFEVHSKLPQTNENFRSIVVELAKLLYEACEICKLPYDSFWSTGVFGSSGRTLKYQPPKESGIWIYIDFPTDNSFFKLEQFCETLCGEPGEKLLHYLEQKEQFRSYWAVGLRE